MNNILTEELLEEKVVTKKSRDFKLILWNDEVNTFDFVIECLINYCKHEPLQAEQCTYLVHYSGKCDVFSGGETVVKKIAQTLGDKGLTVEVVKGS